MWCKKCDGYVYPNHKCPPQWCAWDIESPEDSCIVYAIDEEEAAEKYAEIQCHLDTDCYSAYISGSMDIAVIPANPTADQVPTVFTVRAEVEANFYAKERE